VVDIDVASRVESCFSRARVGLLYGPFG
jgi:hypothetical protein